jgi:hypothetical protein
MGGRAARFVATGSDRDGKPTGFLARSPEEAAKKEAVLTSGADILTNLDRALKVREETGPVGRTLNREGALGFFLTNHVFIENVLDLFGLWQFVASRGDIVLQFLADDVIA